MKLALLISTYNRPDALELCLKSILNQVVLPDEILVADDGSTIETKKVIDAFNLRSTIKLKHIWHEDNGFQLAKIRNKAIIASCSDYIVQIDGDLILHKYFIKDHLDFCRPGTFVRASRTYLNEDITQEKIRELDTCVNLFDKRVSNFFSSFRVPILRRFFETKYKNQGDEIWEIHGCNMAYWREDALRVNGYNEDFLGWGPEDKEFVARLINMGVRKRFLKFGGIAFHLWHPVNKKENLVNNEYIFEDTKKMKRSFCENGLQKYL